MMSRIRFLLTLAAFLATTVQALGAPPGVPPKDPPDDAPGHVRKAPAPVLGAGLAAIIAAGAAGYGLWRRRRGSTDDS